MSVRRDHLSGRARAALAQHQYRVAVQQREMHCADRVLSGALAACDAAAQRESLAVYSASVQELRVAVQRLEYFLLRRLTDPPGHDRADDPGSEHGGTAEL
jgi:hypothetical protein